VINAIIGIAIGWPLAWLLSWKDERKFKLWSQVDSERDLVFDMLAELRDDPAMTDKKWAEWLPVFEYMDRRYAANNFMGLKVTPLAEFVRSQIDDSCYL
jgi:hypothetical protein